MLRLRGNEDFVNADCRKRLPTTGCKYVASIKLLIVNYFQKKAPAQMFDKFLNTPLCCPYIFTNKILFG